MSERRVPRSTYRLQVTAEFPLDAAAGLADYLRLLGADWFYLSPLLQATSGSTHGYDVVDHRRVDVERGGEDGLDLVALAARGHGLGVLIDVVPNHMGSSKPWENAWWWEVLRLGRDAPHAGHFDIDWSAGRLLIPVLGETLDDAAASGALRVERADDGTDELRYHDHRYPVAPGTVGGPDGADPADPVAVHARQHYELADWHRADTDLTYRRFFAVHELPAIRVELPEVFADSHVEVTRWIREGLADGLRIDHPDGLADPGGYLDDLARATGGAYVLVEKILEGDETLPPFWAADGTTGYDALAAIDRVLVDPAGRRTLDKLDTVPGDRVLRWEDRIHGTKRAIADGILNAEVRRLQRELPTSALAALWRVSEQGATRRDDERGTPANDASPETGHASDDPNAAAAAIAVDALAELLACFPVYRSYLPVGVEHLEHAHAEAARRRPELAPALDALLAVLRDPAEPVAIRFQQTSGMVMAKGVEDTAFYRVSRLASLTEVGADPHEFAIGVDEFHARQQQRLAAAPLSMTALSTHDTKRGEDTRARIDAISEVPDAWTAFLARRTAALDLGDPVLENLLWESFVGAWPREREALHGYAEKASREAALSTTWTEPDEAFEARMHALVDSLYDDADTAADLDMMVGLLGDAGRANGLAAKLLQLTAPGVPDVYQGSELWERSLVDPDNRRAVDYAERRRLLAELDEGMLPPVDETGAAKLLVTSRALRLRRDRPELFERYAPLTVVGERADHVVGFDRGGAITVATRLSLGLERAGGWGDTAVVLPHGDYVDELTGAPHPGGELAVADLLARYPVALLAVRP